LVVNKKFGKENLVLERRLVCKEKKTVNVAADAKTRMKQTRTNVEFWSPLFAQSQVTYLTFTFLTLQILTKLKTTFGRNLLYWML
jgi:hypothetical protein